MRYIKCKIYSDKVSHCELKYLHLKQFDKFEFNNMFNYNYKISLDYDIIFIKH